ncbi:MAG: SPOR domain-containing protein [Gemmatimonadota bacterium]|nr:SPOR domain-containing protein [Gemmatimonadota bacterium]
MGDTKRSRDYDWGDYSEKGDRIIAVLGWIVVLLITLYAGIYFGRQTRERARYAEREAPMAISTVQQEKPASVPAQPMAVTTPVPQPEPVKKPEPAPLAKPVVAVPVKTSLPAPATAKIEKPASPPPPPLAGPEKGFSVQVGAFGQAENAGRLKAMLEKKGFTVRVFGPEGSKNLFKVRVGNYASRGAAEAAEKILKDLVQQTLVVQNVPRR